MLSDNWDAPPISSFSLNQLRTRDLNAYNGEVNGLWNDAYRAINMSNIVLHYLPVHENQDITKATLIRGECLFVRAICHFELVRMFAQPAGYSANNNHLGIPIKLTKSSATEGQNTIRSSVDDVYNQVIQDLKEAIAFLPETKDSRVSKCNAIAYLTKVYFQNKTMLTRCYIVMK